MQLKLLPGGNVIATTFQSSAEDQTLNIKTSTALPAGDAELTMEFSGSLSDDYLGCYRDAETKYYTRFVKRNLIFLHHLFS